MNQCKKAQISIEELEKKYFSSIFYVVKANKIFIEQRLKSASHIKKDWINLVGTKNPIEVGAQRVVRSVLLRIFPWPINSTPISSDLCFELEEAIMHLDCKTVKETDGDAKHGYLVVRPNQTSYRGEYKGTKFIPNLPSYYTHSFYKKIPCLTYFLKIIYGLHKEEIFKLKGISLYCIPNGELYPYYDNLIKNFKAYDRSKGKTIGGSARIDTKKMREPKLTKGWYRIEESF